MSDDVLFRHAPFGRLRVVRPGRSVFEGMPFRPPTDVYETEEAVVVVVEAAGMEDGSFEVALDETSRVLTVIGRRVLPALDSKVVYHQMEIAQGDFMSRVNLPWRLENSDAATAEYDDGCLVITLPKAKNRQVPVRPPGRAED